MGCLAMIQAGEPEPSSLLRRVEAYIEKHRISPTRFGILATKNPNLFWRVQAGSRLHPKTVGRIELMLTTLPPPMTIAQQNAQKYQIAKNANNQAEFEEQQRRHNDPLEQAATWLRSRGWRVYRASVHNPDATGWIVGMGPLTDEQMMERARRSGWRG